LGDLSTLNSVQKLQTSLHAKAKAEPGYRFYALYDKISREDILAHAYAQCRSNKGAPVPGAAAALDPIRGMRTIHGTMCDPHTGWLLMRSLETLKLRMKAAEEGARKVADFLLGHPAVASVWYLGFLPEDHPDRRVFERQCKSAGSTFSFEVKGGEAEAFAVLDRLEVIKLAVSLGGTETLASHPASMPHSDIPPEEQLRLGITQALIRLSVGIENPDDLIADLDQALRR
jgi:methionine-gamma-lyase